MFLNFELIKDLLSYTGFTVDFQQNFYPFSFNYISNKKIKYLVALLVGG